MLMKPELQLKQATLGVVAQLVPGYNLKLMLVMQSCWWKRRRSCLKLTLLIQKKSRTLRTVVWHAPKNNVDNVWLKFRFCLYKQLLNTGQRQTCEETDSQQERHVSKDCWEHPEATSSKETCHFSSLAQQVSEKGRFLIQTNNACFLFRPWLMIVFVDPGWFFSHFGSHKHSQVERENREFVDINQTDDKPKLDKKCLLRTLLVGTVHLDFT